MTYKDRFVVEVKCKGKILRVKEDTVYLPFGSEYSLYLKNLNSRRACVNISIDGDDVLDGSSIILNGNQSAELQGFMKGSVAKNRFRFINKTKDIQEHRGDKIDDGIIRVEFAYEKKVEPIVRVIHDHYHKYTYNDCNWQSPQSFTYGEGGSSSNISENVSFAGNSNSTAQRRVVKSNVICDCLESAQPMSDEGITVKGNEIHQQFYETTIGELEASEVIIIRMKGETKSNQLVQTPLMTKTKLTCSTCGKKSKSSAKFCQYCGTFLE
jgi:hypothetical protein